MNPTLPALPPTIKALRTTESRQLNRLYPNLPTSPKQCITCKGKQTFLWYVGDGRADTALHDCPCLDQFILHRVLLHSGVKESYQRLEWADFTSAPLSAYEAVDEYMSHADGYIDAGFGLVLSGTKGTGKTLLAHLLLKRLIAEGKTCYATTFAGMIESFTAGWTSSEDKAWFNARVRHANVLLVDDLGREHHKAENSVGNTMIEAVIRDRVGRGLTTFMTTNLPPDKIVDAYGGNTMSLLTERATIVEMRGEDQRDMVSARLKSEIRAGIQRPVML